MYLLFLGYYKKKLNLCLYLETNLLHHIYCKPIMQAISYWWLLFQNKLWIRNTIFRSGIFILQLKLWNMILLNERETDVISFCNWLHFQALHKMTVKFILYVNKLQLAA